MLPVFGELPERWAAVGGVLVGAPGLYLLWRERTRGTGPSAAV